MGRLRLVSIGVVGVGAVLAAAALGTPSKTPRPAAGSAREVAASPAQTSPTERPSQNGALATAVAAGADPAHPPTRTGSTAVEVQPVAPSEPVAELEPKPPLGVTVVSRSESASKPLDRSAKPVNRAAAEGAEPAGAVEKVPVRVKRRATPESPKLPSTAVADKPVGEAVKGVLPQFASSRGRAVVVGSSSVRGYFGRVISDELEERGFEVTRRGVVSAGLARPDYRDIDEVVDAMPIDGDTAAVFVYVGMNDGQSIWLRPEERKSANGKWVRWQDPRWPDVYKGRARSLFRSICDRGAERAFVMLPIEVPKRRLESKMQRIRKLQRQAAEGVGCARAVATGGEGGKFVSRGKSLRTKDGFHMTRRGARLVWDRVKRRELGSWEPWAQLELSSH